MYGNERGGPGFDAGNPAGNGGYTHFTSGGTGGWQHMGGQGHPKSFSFSFGNSGGQGSSNFDLGDIFSTFFGGDMSGAGQFGSFTGSSRTQSHGFGGSSRSQSSGFRGTSSTQSGSSNYPKSIQDLNSQVYKKEIADQGITWLLLCYSPRMSSQYYESIIEEVVTPLQGALKVFVSFSVCCTTE